MDLSPVASTIIEWLTLSQGASENALFCLKRVVDGVEVLEYGAWIVEEYSGGRVGRVER